MPHKTVLDNVSYGLIVSGVNKKSAIEKAMEQIEMVGLKGYEDQYPTQCSGGMQQRVGLARALLATDPMQYFDANSSRLLVLTINLFLDRKKHCLAQFYGQKSKSLKHHTHLVPSHI